MKASDIMNLDHANMSTDYLNHRYCTPQWCILPAKIDFIDLSYVVAGSATYYVDGVQHEARAGDLLCIPKGSYREAKTHPEDLMECYCLNFNLTDDLTGAEMTLPFEIITPIGIRPQLIRLFSAIYQTWLLKESNYKLQTRGYSLLILSELLSLLQHEYQILNADARVRKVVTHIVEHHGDSLSIPALAELVQLNPVYFCSLFRKSLGTSVNQFIRRVRINHAEMLLEEGVYSVTEIADICGFGNVYYFSRLFKQQKGVPPSVIAKNHSLVWKKR